MSLESAIERLAAATENNVAVREIIRQRDKWQSAHDAEKRRAQMYEQWYDNKRDETERLRRLIAALRGVITRMKRARNLHA